MTAFITKYLLEVKAREDAATPGKWIFQTPAHPKSILAYAAGVPTLVAECFANGKTNEETSANTIFIAHARTDVTRLRLALEYALQGIENAAEFYGLDSKQPLAAIEAILKGEA